MQCSFMSEQIAAKDRKESKENRQLQAKNFPLQ
jgi:hypothetical protein